MLVHDVSKVHFNLAEARQSRHNSRQPDRGNALRTVCVKRGALTLRRDASTKAPQHLQVVAVLQGKSIQVTVIETELL